MKCRNCSKKSLKNRTLCKRCARKNSNNAKAFRQARLDEGLCIRCGKKPHLSDNKLCKKCKPKEAKRNHEYSQKKIAKGLCRICGKRRGCFWKKTRCRVCAIRTRIASFKLSKRESKRALEYALHKFKGCCESCGTSDSGKKHWSLDHNHKTKKFRGILCTRCNVALGMVKDRIRILKCLISYLKTHS